jgi:hypothetical protein
MSRVSSLGPLTSTRQPLLVRPFQAGVIGWIVVFGAIIAELAGGALIYSKFVGAALPVLIIPVVVAYGVGFVLWWLVRRAGADPASWAHLGAVVAALLIWFLWPITPGPLDQSTGSASDLCNALPTDDTAACLPRAAQALDASHLSWYLVLVLFGVSVLLARRSRIAVWAALPAALAACQLASHFLEQILLHYQPIV